MKSNIKKCKLVVVSILFMTLSNSCDNFLENIQPLDKISEDILLSREDGLKTLLANLYNGIPIEDHCYHPDAGGFNRHDWEDADHFTTASMLTDDAMVSNGNGIGMGSYNMWSSGTGSGAINSWDRNRQINVFERAIAKARDNGVINDDTYNRLWSEIYFARAYLYFAMAKRYGGVPIIDWLQDDDYDGDPEPLFIPRSTELDTWMFVMDCCDKAIQYLPGPKEFGSGDGDPAWRATKWAAYALKSRAALYAASIAKYGDRVSFPNCTATDQKLVGIDASQASYFYGQCIAASKAIIDGGDYALYAPNPATTQAAISNYQNLFMNPQDCKEEIILGKTYMDGSVYSRQGHQYDNYYSVYQCGTGFYRSGRYSVMLDIVDVYEDYTDDGTGKSAPIVTRTDGNENDYIITNVASDIPIGSIPFVHYNNPYDAFADKDARLLASVIVPNSTYKGVTIIIQGGLIRKNGELVLYSGETEVGYDGITYYGFGSESKSTHSGFDGPMESGFDANFTNSGFAIRKYMSEDKNVAGVQASSSTPYIDFRLAEIYLNYAEAVVESGSGDAAAAAGYLNAIRRRAGHKDDIPLTLDNVMKERRVELAFENGRIWDMWRRREYHTVFSDNYRRKALVPLIDLREQEPKYVFLRKDNYHDIRAGGRTFQIINYYQNIPGTNVNRLPNNPGRE